MATVAAPTPGLVVSATRAAGKLLVKVTGRVYATAKAGAASALGVAGLASVTVSAALTDARLGWAVGGALAVWLASLLPAGKQ
jgi:hypothetical protein